MTKGIYIRTEEHKKNSSNAMKGHITSEETKMKISNSLKGHKCYKNIKRKEKISESLKEYWVNKSIEEKRILTEDWRLASIKARKDKPLSEDHKRSLSESHKGVKLSEEHCKKIGEGHKGLPGAWKGKKRPEETKRKMSVTRKAKFAKMTKEEKLIYLEKWIKAPQKINSSSIEKMIWEVLDSLNIKYKTQVSFCHSRFIVDIYIPDKNLIIECNGTYWHSLPERIKRDKFLQKYCDKWGVKLVWLWEDKIRKNPEATLQEGLNNVSYY